MSKDMDAKFATLTCSWTRFLWPFLAQMLQLGNYDDSDAATQLEFLASCVSPFLGPRPREWGFDAPLRSFMTDNGTPVEMSWSWTGSTRPMVRYAFEVMGEPIIDDQTDPSLLTQSSENCTDPNESFLKRAHSWCANIDLSWYNLIQPLLTQRPLSAHTTRPTHDLKGLRDCFQREPAHPSYTSQIFWAVDLVGGSRQLKVYHVLNARALAMQCSKLDLVMLALSKLSLDAHMWRAVSYFKDLAERQRFDVEMLSYDCVDVAKSRVKIYFRSWKTSFTEVCSILEAANAGGLETVPQSGFASNGVDAFRKLWKSVIAPGDDYDEKQELPSLKHRTAGILFYYEFKPGSESIRPKVYLPVRHYGRSDAAIAGGLRTLLAENAMTTGSEDVDYKSALCRMVPRRNMEKARGLHTYISCAMAQDKINITTYLNPGVEMQIGRGI